MHKIHFWVFDGEIFCGCLKEVISWLVFINSRAVYKIIECVVLYLSFGPTQLQLESSLQTNIFMYHFLFVDLVFSYSFSLMLCIYGQNNFLLLFGSFQLFSFNPKSWNDSFLVSFVFLQTMTFLHESRVLNYVCKLFIVTWKPFIQCSRIKFHAGVDIFASIYHLFTWFQLGFWHLHIRLSFA